MMTPLGGTRTSLPTILTPLTTAVPSDSPKQFLKCLIYNDVIVGSGDVKFTFSGFEMKLPAAQGGDSQCFLVVEAVVFVPGRAE